LDAPARVAAKKGGREGEREGGRGKGREGGRKGGMRVFFSSHFGRLVQEVMPWMLLPVLLLGKEGREGGRGGGVYFRKRNRNETT